MYLSFSLFTVVAQTGLGGGGGMVTEYILVFVLSFLTNSKKKRRMNMFEGYEAYDKNNFPHQIMVDNIIDHANNNYSNYSLHRKTLSVQFCIL